MTTLLDRPPVTDCSVVGCCYSHDSCEECVPNDALECAAASIHVGGATGAECLTYAVA